MLLSDLGQHTMMSVLDAASPRPPRRCTQATDLLLRWQQASRPGVLPPTTRPCCARAGPVPRLVPGPAPPVQLDDTQRAMLDKTFDAIVRHNLAAPQVLCTATSCRAT
jgi:aminoglycoside/choline kinase family phosphotransferase